MLAGYLETKQMHNIFMSLNREFNGESNVYKYFFRNHIYSQNIY